MEPDEIYEETWESKEIEWLTYIKNDVTSTVFDYARYIMGMEELTGYITENS